MHKKHYALVLVALVYVVLTGTGLKAEQIMHHSLKADPLGDAFHCLACHDGVLSKYAAVCIKKCEQTQVHSILKPYPPQGKENQFNSRAQVEARGIKFEQGRTSCISCHDIRKKRPAHLVMDNRGSRLCLTCHRK